MDEAYDYESPEIRKKDKRWYEQIPCRGGAFIRLYSEDPIILKLYTPMVKSARAILNKMPELEVTWFHSEADIYFPPELFDVIAKMVGAMKKRVGRKLSAKEKARLIEAGKANRFTRKSTGREAEKRA
jgi:hypothetical protein